MLTSYLLNNFPEICCVLLSVGVTYALRRKSLTYFKDRRKTKLEIELLLDRLRDMEKELHFQKTNALRLEDMLFVHAHGLTRQIAILKSDLSIQHQSLATLLTRLVDGR